jgi:hypothetical protein
MGNNGMVVDHEGFMTKRFGKTYSGIERFGYIATRPWTDRFRIFPQETLC